MKDETNKIDVDELNEAVDSIDHVTLKPNNSKKTINTKPMLPVTIVTPVLKMGNNCNKIRIKSNNSNNSNNSNRVTQILFLLNKKGKLSINDISLELNIDSNNIKQTLYRNNDLDKGFFEVSNKNQTPYLWKLSSVGINEFNLILDQEKRIEEQKEKVEWEYQEVTDKINNAKTYFDNINHYNCIKDKFIEVNFLDFALNHPEHADDILEDYEESIKHFEAGLNQIDDEYNNIDIRFVNIPKSQLKSISALTYDDFNKLTKIRGIVVSKSNIRPRLTTIKYECPACGNIITIIQLDKQITEPTACGCGRRGKFRSISEERISVQRLQIEQFTEDLKGVNQPIKQNLILKKTLCTDENQKHFNPGMRIEFTGKLLPDYITNSAGRKKVDEEIIFEVNSYEILDHAIDNKITDKDIKEIEDFSLKENFKSILIENFAPDVRKNELYKLAMILSRVKGQVDDFCKDDRIHLLLSGNPGLGKTDLLEFQNKITPNSRFTEGGAGSEAGIICAVNKDEFIGGWTLFAGAVPLAHNSICFIDEIDNINKDESGFLNQIMQSGYIDVNKATIHQRLQAHTTIIAALNPKNEDTYNTNEVFIKQLNLDKATLDRFDIILGIIGKPTKSFKELLKKKDCVLNEEFISKYLTYASNKVIEAPETIKEYCLEQADKLEIGFSKRFNFQYRQMFSLYKLSIAFAKLSLRTSLTQIDVDNAVDFFIKSMGSMNISYDPPVNTIKIQEFNK